MKPAITMQGIATNPTNPSLHSNMKASIIPVIIEEKFITNVEIIEVVKLFTCLESIPNLVAAVPPRLALS